MNINLHLTYLRKKNIVCRKLMKFFYVLPKINKILNACVKDMACSSPEGLEFGQDIRPQKTIQTLSV